MTELQVVEWLKRVAPATGKGVVLGIGDDCAIFRPRGGAPEDLLFTTDQCLAGVHFRSTDPADLVGHLALGRGISDIAAMGGSPRFCLVSLSKPRNVSDGWIRGFYRGLLRLAGRFGVVLAGGDLAKGPTLGCDVVVCGSVRRGGALRRDGARPGDRIYVSGPLGGPAASGYAARAFEPRVRLGRRLVGVASACIDVTDGLALDLHRLCVASGVSASIEAVPLVPGATVEQALSGGDEYELLFTSSSDPSVGIPIGVIEVGEPGALWRNGSRLTPSGYDHFRSH